MIVKFDALRHLETPEFILCNPGSVREIYTGTDDESVTSEHATKTIGMIPNHSDEELVFNFNSPSELNFRTYRVDMPDKRSNVTLSHTVAICETINGIAKKYGVTADDIVNANSSTYSTISTDMNVPAGYPIITSQPADATAAVDEYLTFSVSVTGNDLSYQWQYRYPNQTDWTNSTASGAQTASIRVTARAAYNGVRYRCRISNNAGSVVSRYGTVNVAGAVPVILSDPSSVNICRGQRASFSVAAAGADMSYQWEFSTNGGNTWNTWSGHDTATTTVTASSGNNGVYYRCVVTNSSGSATSGVAQLTSAENLPIITTHPASQTVEMGSSFELSVTASGTVTGYQWQYSVDNGLSWGEWVNKNTDSVISYASETNDGVLYRCAVTNNIGTVYSDPAALTVTGWKLLTVGWVLSIPNQNGDTYAKKVFDGIQNRRLIFVPGIGYYLISGVTNGFDGEYRYKDVSAESIETELQNHVLPYIPDGTYRFSTDPTLVNPEPEEYGLIERIIDTLPLWSAGYIDDTVKSRYRSFQDIDTNQNVLSFLIDNVQDAYECIVVFDTLDRKINVYNQETYTSASGAATNIHLTKDDFASAIDVSENSDDLYTAINVLGENDISIASVNPTGTNTIYRFDHYADWMTPALGAKVLGWESEINKERGHYITTNKKYYATLTKAANLQYEIDMLNEQLTMYQRCRDNIVAENSTDIVNSYNSAIAAAGGTEIIAADIAATLANIDSLIASVKAQINTKTASHNAANAEATEYLSDIAKTNNRLNITSYFTASELTELDGYIFEGLYRDEYVIITEDMTYDEQFDQMRTLYTRANDTLAKTSEPTQEINVDVASFLFEKDFMPWSDQLRTGCLIGVETLDDGVAQLFLATMTINYEDKSFSMTFGNRYNKFDPKSLFENVLGGVTKSANSISNIKSVIVPIKDGEFNAMRVALQKSRDITMAAAFESDKEEVVIDKSGYTGRSLLSNGEYDPRQVKIVGKSIVFTDDGWEHAKVAVGEIGGLSGTEESTVYGINAEYVVGDMVVGGGLSIKATGTDGVTKDILSVIDDRIEASASSITATAESYTDDKVASVAITPESLELQIKQGAQAVVDGQTSFSPTTGFTFDSDGLTINKSGSTISNTLDESGMYVRRNNNSTDVLVANNEGVKAINLSASQYLTMGLHSRFEDYTDADGAARTACFYI